MTKNTPRVETYDLAGPYELQQPVTTLHLTKGGRLEISTLVDNGWDAGSRILSAYDKDGNLLGQSYAEEWLRDIDQGARFVDPFEVPSDEEFVLHDKMDEEMVEMFEDFDVTAPPVYIKYAEGFNPETEEYYTVVQVGEGAEPLVLTEQDTQFFKYAADISGFYEFD